MDAEVTRSGFIGSVLLGTVGLAVGKAATRDSTPSASQSELLAARTGRVKSRAYRSVRYTIDTARPFGEFVAQYEAAVPNFDPAIFVNATGWDEVIARTNALAINGFLIYNKLASTPFTDIARIGQDVDSSNSYLMGNHVIAETMYRYNPGVVQYAPLRVELFENRPGGSAQFSVVRPSDPFSSFDDPRIAAVGHELNQKLAHLLAVLQVEVPKGLA